MLIAYSTKELMAIADLHHYDIIVITETLPKNRERMYIQILGLGINGNNLYTNDTDFHTGRGVVIYIRMQINSAPVTVLHTKHIEVVSVKIKLINNDRLVIHDVSIGKIKVGRKTLRNRPN